VKATLKDVVKIERRACQHQIIIRAWANSWRNSIRLFIDWADSSIFFHCRFPSLVWITPVTFEAFNMTTCY